MDGQQGIEFDQGWEIMQKGIDKLVRIVEGLPEPKFTADESMNLYTTCYNMCWQTQGYRYAHARQLFDKYRETLEEYINSTVLPSLQEKCDESKLREFVKRRANHKFMVKRLYFFFNALDSFSAGTARNRPPSLNGVGFTCFRDLVYQELYPKVIDAVICLIDREREGEQIDRVLLKNVLDIFLEFGLERYERDFEVPMLGATSAYYKRKVSTWIRENSRRDYLAKIGECLEQEKDRADHYLHPSTAPNLQKKVRAIGIDSLSCL